MVTGGFEPTNTCMLEGIYTYKMVPLSCRQISKNRTLLMTVSKRIFPVC